MKKTTWIIGTLAGIFGTATTAMAATGVRTDNSDILVWIFLGLCALIVLGQMVPVVLMAMGFLRGLTGIESKPKAAESPQKVANR